MTGDGVGIFELEGVVVGVFPDGLVDFLFGLEVGIVGRYALIEDIGLVVGERSAFALEGVEYDFRFYFQAVVVREGEAER